MSKKTKVFKVSDLSKKVPNRFMLSVGTAIRARQLQEGARPLISDGDGDDTSVVTALREFDQSKIKLVKQEPEPDLMDLDAMDTAAEDDVIEELLSSGDLESIEEDSQAEDAEDEATDEETPSAEAESPGTASPDGEKAESPTA